MSSSLRQRAGAHEALDRFFSAPYTGGSVLFPLCFPKKATKTETREKETKQNIPTNQQQQKNLIAGLCGIGLYQFGLELEEL